MKFVFLVKKEKETVVKERRKVEEENVEAKEKLRWKGRGRKL